MTWKYELQKALLYMFLRVAEFMQVFPPEYM